MEDIKKGDLVIGQDIIWIISYIAVDILNTPWYCLIPLYDKSNKNFYNQYSYDRDMFVGTPVDKELKYISRNRLRHVGSVVSSEKANNIHILFGSGIDIVDT